MNDAAIVQLFFQRSELAVAQARAQYGAYCTAIARRILPNTQDVEEAVQDTWLAAWNSIPPQRPIMLKTYLGKLARRAALQKWRAAHAAKRGGGEVPLALDELAECLPAENGVEQESNAQQLTQSINRFLESLETMQRRVFLCRYWYLEPVEEIAGRFGFSQSKVKSMLFRLRKRLQANLEREGFWHEKQ